MKRFIWGSVSVAVVAVVVVAVGFAFHSDTYRPPAGTVVAKNIGTVSYQGKSYRHVELNLATYPDSAGKQPDGKLVHPNGNPDWPAYAPSNEFQVPANSYVTMTIKQYDTGEPLNNPWFAKVVGTIGGVATIDGKRATHANAEAIGHTFTLRGAPGVAPNFFVNVPLPPLSEEESANDAPHPRVVTFSFISGPKGVYVWNCEFPCGSMVAGFGGPMSAYGFMTGHLNVV